MSGGSTSPAFAEAAATNSRASLAGVGEGLAPGYPAAAARPFFSSPKVEEMLTASCWSYGGLIWSSGIARASGHDQPPGGYRKYLQEQPCRCVRSGGVMAHANPSRLIKDNLCVSVT